MLGLFNISTTFATFSMLKMSQHVVGFPLLIQHVVQEQLLQLCSVLPSSQLVFFLSDRLFMYLVIYFSQIPPPTTIIVTTEGHYNCDLVEKKQSERIQRFEKTILKER